MHVGAGGGNRSGDATVTAVLSTEWAPVRRLQEDAEDRQGVSVATLRDRTCSLISTDRDQVICSSVQVETLTQRCFEGVRP